MAIVKKYRAKVISVSKHTDTICTTEFCSESGKFIYHPGQFLHLALDQDYDGCGQWPESRCFSMQSNPNEKNIKITYSVKGRFTFQMGRDLKIGSMVWLKLPYGDLFTRPHSKTNTVFIAGGTGITPFLSLLTHESFKDYIKPRIYLGFRSSVFNIYNEDINKANHSSVIVKIFYEDEDGVIDIQHIFDENGQSSDYFISGPPLMIKIFKQTLIGNNVLPHRILTDDWE